MSRMAADKLEVQVPPGAYMVLWFVNPHEIPSADGSKWNHIASRFYSSIESAEKYAQLFAGDRIILQAIPASEGNIEWHVVKRYGESFDLGKIIFLPEGILEVLLKMRAEEKQ